MEYQILKNNDTFCFACDGCGKCCQEREDILLTPSDLYKMSKYLQISIKEFIETYCELYRGESTNLPLVRILPQEICPLNKEGKCIVHSVKPYVCALYPLGFMMNYTTKDFDYFLQPAECENYTQTQVVGKWLEDYSLIEEEKLTIIWHEFIKQYIDGLAAAKDLSDIDFESIYTTLYLRYDLETSWMAQFKLNCNEVLSLLERGEHHG